MPDSPRRAGSRWSSRVAIMNGSLITDGFVGRVQSGVHAFSVYPLLALSMTSPLNDADAVRSRALRHGDARQRAAAGVGVDDHRDRPPARRPAGSASPGPAPLRGPWAGPPRWAAVAGWAAARTPNEYGVPATTAKVVESVPATEGADARTVTDPTRMAVMSCEVGDAAARDHRVVRQPEHRARAGGLIEVDLSRIAGQVVARVQDVDGEVPGEPRLQVRGVGGDEHDLARVPRHDVEGRRVGSRDARGRRPGRRPSPRPDR